jgi:iron complex outermembrane receptor protein
MTQPFTRKLLALLIAAASAPGALAQTAANPEEIVVSGRRVSTAANAIGQDSVSNSVGVTREALLSAPAGISGLKMLETLPGFNVQTDGALGLYEFGNSVTVRAFNLQQIGFVLDGIPMGRSDAFGGSPIFRYVDNENLGRVQASPGACDVSQPAYASLGPIVEYHSIDPSDEFAVALSQSLGEFSLDRSFIKIQSGQIGMFSGYISRSKTDSDLWRGAGDIDREHLEAKAVIDFSDVTKLTTSMVYNDFFDYDSPGMTIAQYNSATPDLGGKTGRDLGYIGFVPDLGVGAAVPFQNANYTYYYEDRVNIRKDFLLGSTLDTQVNENLSLTATAYFEDKDGYGVSPDGYANTLTFYNRQRTAGLAVTAPRGVQYGLSDVGGERSGLVLKGVWDSGANQFEAGVWVENDDYDRTQLRLNKTGGNPAGRVIENEVAYFRRDYNSLRETTQLFIKDTYRMMDGKLAIEGGIKSLSIDYQLSGYRDFADYALTNGTRGYGAQTVKASYDDHFLPMVGALYALNEQTQVFASASRNFALPRGADDVFAIASPVAVPAPDAEESDNYEIGIRTNQPEYYAAVALYVTQFDNRLQAFTVPLAGAPGGTETFSQNVGGVSSYGAELTGSWKPEALGGQIYFNSNLTLNNTTFDDNYQVYAAGNTTTPRTVLIKDNDVPDSPKVMFTAGVTWEPTSWLVANLSGKYTDKRYSNFINTEEVEAYSVWSAYVDIGDGMELGPLKQLKARVNVDNLFDEDTLAFTNTATEGAASFRPLSPRTLQVSFMAEF